MPFDEEEFKRVMYRKNAIYILSGPAPEEMLDAVLKSAKLTPEQHALLEKVRSLGAAPPAEPS